jgi:hypothetical protein
MHRLLSGFKNVLPVLLSCHGLYVLQPSIADNMHTIPGDVPLIFNLSDTKLSLRIPDFPINSTGTF